jgi:hypothetical protein
MSEEIKEMDKEFNQTAIKQELASSIDEKAETASMESNKNLIDVYSERAKFIQWYQNDAIPEMLVLLEDCLSEIVDNCMSSCDHVGTPDCMNDCDTYNLRQKIKATIRKAKGE